MSFFGPLFLNAHLLVIMLTVVAGDHIYVQEAIGKEGRRHFKNAALQERYGQTAEFTPLFAKELNQMQSMADLVSFLVPGDRRFCSNAMLRLLRDAQTATLNVTRWQHSMVQLQEHCARYKRGRLTPVEGLRMQEITKIDHARLEAKKVSCKPRVVHVELPPAPLGSWYYPQCVTAKRCGGCCNSALLECKPRNITIVKKWGQGALDCMTLKMNYTRFEIPRVVMKFQVPSKNKYEKTLSFPIEQHKSCECGCKTLASHCSKMQVYDEESCECKCINESEVMTCLHPKEWDSRLCSCVCPQSLFCSTGAHIHPESCKCISEKNSKQSRERKGY